MLMATSEYLEFCPECFLVDDFRQIVQRPWTPLMEKTMAEVDLSQRLDDQSRRIYERAANSEEACFTPNDILALVPDDGMLDSTRIKIIQYLLVSLKRDFWARLKYEDDCQPSLAERMLMLNLQKVVNFYLINCGIEEAQRRLGQVPAGCCIVPEEDVAETDYCNICREPFGTLDEDGKTEHCVKIVTCNHTFGNQCLILWLKSNKTCPLCRRRVVPHAQPHRLAEDAAEPEVADFAGRLVRFNAFSFDEDIIIYNARTPPWMVALLGATEIAEGEDNEPRLGNHLLLLELHHIGMG
jgi:hypothetical protein